MNGNKNWLTVSAVILGILILILAGWWVKKKYIDRPTLITVVGEGRVKTRPQMVKFTVTLSNTAETAASAVGNNNRLTKDAISMIKGAGVGEQDIIVSYVRVVPPGTTLGQISYQAINTIDVTLKDLSGFDNLVNRLYSIGAQSISNIVFTIQNSREMEKQAVTQAIKDAQARVGEIARVAGKKPGRMVSIQAVEVGEAGALSGEAPRQTAFGGQVSSSPSQIEIVRRASIVFELR